MKTLIVDDQYENKVDVVAGILNKIGSQIDHVVSARDALKYLKQERYDLLILDLQIPNELGSDPDVMGGKVLLEYIELNAHINKPSNVLAITSHQESYDACKEFFSERGWPLVYGVDNEEALLKILSTLKSHSSLSEKKYDVAIITALEHTELAAVLKLPCNWTPYHEHDDPAIYHIGTFQCSDGSQKSVIAASCPRIGMAAAAAFSTKLCLQFNPTFLIMTGIAAGIKKKVKLGDILVADPSWDWGSGKLTIIKGAPAFLSAPHQIPLDPILQPILKNLSANRTYLDKIYTEWKGGKRPAHDLNMHVGPIATGAVVLEDPSIVELIKTQNRNTIGVEMEAYGVMSAAFNSRKMQPKVLVIKSVCDFADPSKNNEWQAYAAYTSSSMAYQLMCNHLF